MKKSEGIAIVGMDCRYPGANNINEFWENILAARQQFRAMPDKRLNLDYYGTDDKDAVDLTYIKKAAVLTDYHFDRVKFRVSKSTFEQTDLTHWLALDVAAGALADAGFENGVGLPKDKVGVIIGNSLTGEFTRANIMRLRWPYVFKVFESTLSNLDYSKEEIASILSQTEKVYKEPFPKPDADTLAGGLSNTIAGRVCNYFDFNGGGYTVDGACSSSLLALTNGCNAIINGEMEMALVGGVDLSIDPFEMIGFARNGALAVEDMQVFGDKSQGFWPGEGCGIVLMMKESQAKEMGLNIYSVIRGWGISSDGKGGMTRPKPETQQLALERAYSRSGIDISQVTMFEAHGTGTQIGDNIELTALTNALSSSDKLEKPAIVSSVKHLIGHTKAAAGIAGVIKASMATKNKVVPPSVGTSGAHPVIKENNDKIKVVHEPIPHNDETAFISGVSSFGFGGINAHIVLESASLEASNYSESALNKYANSTRDFEIFPFTAVTKEALIKKLEQVAKIASKISRAQFLDLSNSILKNFKTQGTYKASIVAATPDQLEQNVKTLLQHLEVSEKKLINEKEGVYFNENKKKENIAFLFPGQGAPIYNGQGGFKKLHQEVSNESASIVDESNDILESTIVDTEIAQPKIVESTLESIELLKNLGVNADYGVGHSLGEISALAWAKTISKDQAIHMAQVRGNCMSSLGEEGGTMLALSCEETVLNKLIENIDVVITGYNGKNNYVVGGIKEAIIKVEGRAFSYGVKNALLKVSHAFHTPMMRNAALEFKKHLDQWEFKKPSKNVISTITGDKLEEDSCLGTYLYEQIENPVKFSQAIESLKENTLFFIEVGPGTTLQKTLKNDADVNVVSLNYGNESLKGLLSTLSASFIHGAAVKFEALTTNRFFKTFDIENWVLDVLINPCEMIDFKSSDIKELMNQKNQESEAIVSTDSSNLSKLPTEHTEEGVLTYLKNLISEKTEIPVEVITNGDRIMSQLHLNSLVITEIVSLVAKSFNKSHKVYSAASILANADGTIEELSKLIYEGENDNRSNSESKMFDFSEYTNWTHIFNRIDVVKKRSKIKTIEGEGAILIQGTNSNLTQSVQNLVNTQKFTLGNGGVFVYQNTDTNDVLQDFLHFLKHPQILQSNFVAVIQVNNSKETTITDLKPVFRSFMLEHSIIEKTLVLEIAETIEDKLTIIKEELEVISNYKEVIYSDKENRFESQCEVFFPEKGSITNQITSDDVILATGGGKGITFESVFQLAKKTNAKLAILGRSKENSSKELSDNLALLKEQGIDFNYYSVDVCSEDSTAQTIEKIKSDFKKISVIVHGAGINNPKSIQDLQAKDFEITAEVKVNGLKNVINQLEIQDLRFVIGYGSIIAQSGMQGNADYAFANDQLALYIQDLKRLAPNCRCLTLEWSVWDETGMGANLNSIDSLKRIGVWPIPVKNGVTILENILADASCQEGRYIVSGRYGTIPTLTFSKKKNTLDRFVSKIVYQIPEVEIISEVGINLNDDIYLKNHVFNGQYVFPTVMILEGMAQCCNSLSKNKDSWNFENLKINKSIFIPEKGVNKIRFVVSRVAENTFQAAVLSEDSSFEVKCFEATITYKSVQVANRNSIDTSSLTKLAIHTPTHFYDDLLFHHGPFRRIKHFHEVNALDALALTTTSLEESWFGDFVSANLILGDPGLNDAAIHCHQACRPSQQLLPTAASEIYINANPVEGSLYIHTNELEEIGNETTINVYITNAEGEVKQYWKGLVLTKVTGVDKNQKWIPELLKPYLEYHIKKIIEKPFKLTLSQVENFVKSTIEKGFATMDIDADFMITLGTEQSYQDESKDNENIIFNSSTFLENYGKKVVFFISKRKEKFVV
ncbi:type I polyketide synthase [Flavivirga jejuensis]|uniref:SDR family NAD(P)-dependent oxidoreductase n=1 Tax=Flavivirga jejuensis TaxID=870487 RepID=A0ABT8WMM6_9FLAO|nr:type I polyketide synthase [Flavivirga jejuensis]MDO5974417.1 SDR family NAD(P)-dependent oxidoreductase [Flavivirga jejuensis]